MEINDLLQIKNWFLIEKRHLPWREDTAPYRIWISEIMLQQTQVSVVIPYFENWMQCFPSIKSLAEAPLNEVLKAWEGLGYYSRARYLHAGAKYIMEHYDGIFPETEELLKKIKGIGPYTVGAILSFAFHQRIAAVDGNVLRVLARYYAINEEITNSKTIKIIRSKAQNLLPDHEPWIITEALIELGATLCNRRPKCFECPLKGGCLAHHQGIANLLPVKAKKTATTQLYRAIAVITYKDHLLLRKGSFGKIMADLYEFPYFEMTSPDFDILQFSKNISEQLGINMKWEEALPHVKHSFTRYRATLFPHLYTANTISHIDGYEWHSIESVKNLTFSSGHRQIKSALQLPQ